MTLSPQLSADRKTLRIRVPMEFKKRGGRKLVITPANASWDPPTKQVDKTMVKAVARGFRWRCMLESGEYGSISELAKAEKINKSYMCRVLRLTTLAPDIVENVLNGQPPTELQLAHFLKPFPFLWKDQRSRFDAFA